MTSPQSLSRLSLPTLDSLPTGDAVRAPRVDPRAMTSAPRCAPEVGDLLRRIPAT